MKTHIALLTTEAHSTLIEETYVCVLGLQLKTGKEQANISSMLPDKVAANWTKENNLIFAVVLALILVEECTINTTLHPL